MSQREQAETHRKRTQAASALAVRLGRRYAPARATFDAFRVDYQPQAEAVRRIRALAADPKAAGNVVLYGSVGTGKDHLLAAMLYAAVGADLSVGWVNGQEVYSRFRDAMDSKRSEEELMKEFTRPDVLGISDPIPPVVDPNKPAAWRTELLFRVLDNRYRDMRLTWITCNAESPDDLETKLSSPVYDRLKDGAVLVPCFWPSYREAKR